MGREFEGWCILRTKAGHTMRLAETLAVDGFEVWTPIETKTIRVPRLNIRRAVRLPMMPSYVFAKAQRLIDLLQLSDRTKDRTRCLLGQQAHPEFRVMRRPGGIPTVPDAEFAALRRIEARRTPARRAERAYSAGVTVRVEGGSFGGMQGVVGRSDQALTVITFGNGSFRVTLPTCILSEAAVLA